MTTKPLLTAVQRRERNKIKELIRDARTIAEECRLEYSNTAARLLDDLADIAEKYMEGLK